MPVYYVSKQLFENLHATLPSLDGMLIFLYQEVEKYQVSKICYVPAKNHMIIIMCISKSNGTRFE